MAEFVWRGDNRGGSGGGGGGGSPYWIDPVADQAALPPSAPEGTIALVLDKDALYERKSGAWVLFIDPSVIQDDLTDLFNITTILDNRITDLEDITDQHTIDIAALDADKQDVSEKGQPNGYASLDANGQIPSAQLPPVAITDTFVVNSQAAQTALIAEVGDVAVRTDLSKSYILRVEPASTFSNWQELLTPTDTVLSVNGQTGVVSLTTGDIAEGANLYFTDERAQDAVGSILADSASVDFTYNDAGNSITATVLPAGVDKNSLGGSALTIANGGTGASNVTTARNNLSPLMSAGDIWYHNGSGNTRLGVGNSGQKLGINSTLFGTGLLGWLNDNAQGEKNYAAASANSQQGWATSGIGISLSTVSANNANAPANATASSTLVLTRASGTDYAYTRFTLDRADYGKTLKVAKEMSYAGVAGDYTVRVFSNTLANYTGTSTELSVSPTTSLPGNYTGLAQMTFVAPGSTAPYIEVRIYGNAGTTPLYLNNFLVGPGVIGQVPAVGPWTSYSPAITSFGTVTAVSFQYRVNGDSIDLRGIFSAGTSVASVASITLPNSYTAISLSGGGSSDPIGRWTRTQQANATARKEGSLLLTNNSNLLQFSNLDFTTAGAPTTALNGSAIATGENVEIYAYAIPVNQLAGSGTVNLGAGAQPSYASNSSTSTATDSTSFQYGEAGAPVQAFAPAGATAVSKRVRSPYPNPKFAILQFRINGQWVQAGETLVGFAQNDAGTTSYGCDVLPVSGSTTDYDVRFFSQAYVGQAWSALLTVYTHWRVVFADTPAAVGFALATATESGLVSNESSGSFTVYLKAGAGGDVANGTANWYRVGKQVTVVLPSLSAGAQTATSYTLSTSNANASNLWPAAITPQRTQVGILSVQNNTVGFGSINITSAGVVQLGADANGAGATFTSVSGTKGLPLTGETFTYMLA